MRPHCWTFTLSSLALLGSALAISGCGFTAAPVASSGSLLVNGSVMGGEQPVVGSIVKLYVAGNTGNGSAATDILGTGTGSPLAYATTASDGTFSITGDYTCPAATSSYAPQVYLVATGGNPGLAGNVNNSSLVMVDALGPCSNLHNIPTVHVNEVTTVAAAWALAGFAASATNIGGSATNVNGLANAFINTQLIVDPTTGVSPGSSLASGNTIETGKVYALADVIASCVNSDGTTPCQTLFTTSGQCTATCTSDTFSAALYIVKHPAQNTAALFSLIPTQQPYATTLSASPNDWTLSMTVTGGGVNMPTELALDSVGNVWVADYYGAVSAFSPQGTALSPSTGFGSGVLLPEIFGLAVDGNNNVWVDIQEKPSGISGVYGISSGQTLGSVISVNGSTITTSNYVYYPEELATEQNGNIIVGNNSSSTASVFYYTPAAGIVFTLANVGSPYSTEPTDVSGDANNGIWLADEGGNTVTHVDSSGNLISHPNCCSQANGVGTDSLGNAWVSNFHDNSVSEILPGCDSNATPGATCYNNQQNVIVIGATADCGNAGAPSGSCGDTNGGTYTPAKIVIDGAQNVWLVNYHGGSITSLAGNFNSQPAGTGFSPPTTFDSNGNVITQGGYGLDAKLLNPFDLAPDASGNIWVANEAYNNVVMFFGLAAPTATPRLPTPVAP
jgi:hypothetical protein